MNENTKKLKDEWKKFLKDFDTMEKLSDEKLLKSLQDE